MSLPQPSCPPRVGAASSGPAHLAAGAARPLGALGAMAGRGPSAQDLAPSARSPDPPTQRSSLGGRAPFRPNPFNLLSPRAFRKLILETGFPESRWPPGGHSWETMRTPAVSSKFWKVLGTAPVRSGILDVHSVSLGSGRPSPFSMAKVGAGVRHELG